MCRESGMVSALRRLVRSYMSEWPNPVIHKTYSQPPSVALLAMAAAGATNEL